MADVQGREAWMPGVLTHAGHLVLVLPGLAGVTALLLPQLRQAHSPSRVPTFVPPATPTEHEQRIAALRHAARTGALTARPHRGVTERGRDTAPWRAIAVSSSTAAAAAHAAMVLHHLGAGVLVAGFFLLTASAQALWAHRATRAATDQLLLVAIAGNLALIALWATTRIVGLPWGLLPAPEGLGAWDVATVVWEWSVVLACTSGLFASRAHRRLSLGRPGGLSWLWLIVSGLALSVLSISVGHG